MKIKPVSIPNEIMLATVSDILREGGTVEMSVRGNSMSPFIRNGRDSVELKKMPYACVGDIVLAEIKPGEYVVHRVHSASGGFLTLKGDGNLDCVEHCSEDDVRGTVIRIIRPGHHSFNCLSDRFRRMSDRWVSAPRRVRRYFLAIYSRIKIL